MDYEIRSGKSFITSRAFLESKGLRIDEGVFIDPNEKNADMAFDDHEGDTMHIVTDGNGIKVGIFYSTAKKFYPDNPNFDF